MRTGEISVQGTVAAAVNFAMQQNYVPVVRQILLTYSGEETAADLTVRITAEPAFAETWIGHVALLEKDKPFEITGINLILSTGFFAGLTERMEGRITVQVVQETADNGEQALAQESYPVSLLTYDQWSGILIMPELAAAFVTPNHPELGGIVKKASGLLEDWDHTAFCGYQAQNPNQVRMQMAALYEILRKKEITYCMPPASFETAGQRIRLAGEILSSGLGTCLDLSLLYAGCLEAVGLNPLLIFVRGHAFAGCWLEDQCFPECVQDDVSLLTKRTAQGIHEICLVECTGLCGSESASFDEAVQAADRHLADPEEFEFFLDLKRIRGSGIRPLPIRTALPDGTFRMEEAPQGGQNSASAPEALDVYEKLAYTDHIEVTRQQIWERKLLDLSLRNTLINFRVTKHTLQLMITDLGGLEDGLAQGTEFQIMPVPRDFENELRDGKIYEIENKRSLIENLAKTEFANKRLRSFLDGPEVAGAVTGLYRLARMNMEENGTNTLYIALGFLRWYASDVSERARYAPLVLVPVEIVRKSALKGYVIRGREEEAQMNVTLLEMLRQDFGIAVSGLDPLPSDENGVDLKRVFSVIRQAVMDRGRWDIEELAFLGLFSFNQFIMWNDIRNRSEELKKNKVVRSLISGKMEWVSADVFPQPGELDEEFAPGEVAVPLSADSSQLAAVCASGKGESFILHGPPGTGKSQTITNMIANALYHGKSVLFIAEKMAALSVVQKRLTAIGVGDFCLELHSNKAKKKDVLGRLDAALQYGRVKAPEEYEEAAEQLNRQRTELNCAVEALHKKRKIGKSLYEMITLYEQNRDAPEGIRFSGEEAGALTKELMEEQIWTLRKLTAAGEAAGGVCGHPLREIRSPLARTAREQFPAKMQEWRAAIDGFSAAFCTAASGLGLALSKRKENADRLCRIAELLDEVSCLPEKLFESSERNFMESDVDAVREAGKRRDGLELELLSVFLPGFVKLPTADLSAEWERAGRYWFLKKMLARARIRKELKACAAEPSAVTAERVPEWLAKMEEYHEMNARVKGFRGGELFGRLWKNGRADWEEIGRTYRVCTELSALLNACADSTREAAKLRQSFFNALYAGDSGYSADEACSASVGYSADAACSAGAGYPADAACSADAGYPADAACSADAAYSRHSAPASGAAFRGKEGVAGNAVLCGNKEKLLSAYRKVYGACEEIRQSLSGGAGMNFEEIDGSEDWFAAMKHTANRLSDNVNGLYEWSAYRECAEKAKECGLAGAVKVYEEGMRAEDVLPSYYKAVSLACADLTIDGEEILAGFHGALFDEKVAKYKELCENFERLTRQEIAARLSARVPQVSEGISQASEIGILLKAIRSGGRMQSIRRLFESIPNLLGKLCPCMLMSPISAAQYIDPSYPPFDLVIFDEASQLPTSEAVGAIARGKDVIVVGDPRQLPPTSFFKEVREDEDNLEKEDLESILDDCLALSMPQEHLLWHYRSRHESLIAFSNLQYYDNRLYTFPSPNDLVSRVRLVSVEGAYDRGKTKQNRAEADAVVAEIIRRLERSGGTESIGVVTFSAVQQNLIEDRLMEEFAKRPEIDEANHSSAEPVFVKNLENVQGDERDVILFSVGYGPDANGKVALNFGPLNRDGGWRRLNVAVSRARREMVVFSVLKPEQIDESRTRAEGVIGLKHFLEFAQRGKSALAVRDGIAHTVPDEEGQIIAERIRELGYRVDTNIGCSGYKIDIGIVNPDNPEEYLLGVMFDGENYRSADTAKDRNVIRENILRALGWKLHRLWIIDWFENPEKELQKIRQAAERAALSPQSGRDDGVCNSKDSPEQPAYGKEVGGGRSRGVAEDAAPPPPVFEKVETVSQPENESSVYVRCILPQEGRGAEALCESGRTRTAVDQIRRVVETESPVSEQQVIKRVLEAWGISRMGNRLMRRFDELFRLAGVRGVKEGNTVFYWKEGQEESEYTQYRRGDGERREFSDIPRAEICNAACGILKVQLSLPEEELTKQICRIFGYVRGNAAIEAKVADAVEYGIQTGRLTRDAAGRIAAV